MPLKERVFNCEACHISIGRDLNASLNARTLRRRLFGLSLWNRKCRHPMKPSIVWKKQERSINTGRTRVISVFDSSSVAVFQHLRPL
ncbi:hypothetical protein [Limnoraphis robusta]|uniref:hypothetical protein n=1 Tax=Limnoraphis robusta TaxID=1118279 RepID=UPI003CC94926